MDTADYWLMACKYSIWNATIVSLQLWTEDIDPVTLSRATECVYTAFVYTSTSHTLHQQSDETLFGCFIIALNAAFTQQLPLAEDGYKSGTDTIELPTPLHGTSEETPERTFCIHKHRLLHSLCQYPCPYENYNTLSYMDSLDLSDISDYEDYMVTSSDEELLGMEKVPYKY